VYVRKAGGGGIQILGSAGAECSADEWNGEQIGVGQTEEVSGMMSMLGRE